MVLGGVQAFNLVSILLLVVPGWLGVKLYLDGVSRPDRLGRIDTVVVSIGVSLCILLTLAVYYVVGICTLTLLSPPWYPTARQLSPLVESPALLTINYVNLVLIAALLGNYCAYRGHFIGQLPDAPNKVWRTRLEAVENSPGDDKIRVVMTDDDHIVGELVDWSPKSRDLVVDRPKRIEVGVTGEEHVVKRFDSSVYLRDSEVTRVHVENPESGDESSVDPGRPEADPDREVVEMDRVVSEGTGSDE